MAKRITKRTRLAQKKRKKNMLLALVGLMLLIITYAGLGWGLTHKNVAIVVVSVSGNEMVSTERLEATVRQGLSKVRGLLLYGGTIFTYDKDAIKSGMLYTYPRLESVELAASKIDTLELTVTEREAMAQWCEEDSCYLLDQDGFVFEKVSDNIQAVGLTMYTGDLSGDDVLRQSLLHGRFAGVYDFVTGFESDTEITVIKVVLLDGEAEVHSNEHPILKIKLDENLEKTLSYIKLTLDSEEYKELSESEEGVGYIDVRFGNRVYYK